MTTTQSSEWFAEKFNTLTPLLQDLHINGGKLTGPVNIYIANGIRGIFAKKIAHKLGIPTSKGDHTLQVDISHCKDGLHWDRCFDNTNIFKSVFKPIGKHSNGYWLENTGKLQIQLTVEIKEGGWYWRVLKSKIYGVNIPLFLFPKTTAYKVIENNSYRFYVGISYPIFGTLLSYSGLLNITN